MTSAVRTGQGRQRDAELTDRILDTTARMLGESGYSQLKVEQVAAAVGCGKTAIYRRWPTRVELTVTAICHWMELGEPLNSGSVVEDLIAHVWQNVQNQHPDGRRGELSLWAIASDPELRTLFTERFGGERRKMGRDLITAGISRGELPADADADAMLDLLAGFVYYRRSMRGLRIRRTDVRAVVEPMVREPPRKAIRRS